MDQTYAGPSSSAAIASPLVYLDVPPEPPQGRIERDVSSDLSLANPFMPFPFPELSFASPAAQYSHSQPQPIYGGDQPIMSSAPVAMIQEVSSAALQPAAEDNLSKLEEMGKTLMQTAHDMKSGAVGPNSSLPRFLQNLVHDISSEVDQLVPALNGLTLPAEPNSAGFLEPVSQGRGLKRGPSPNLDGSLIRPQKASRPMKVEPTDEPLQTNLPLATAGLPLPPLPPQSFGGVPLDNYDMPSIPMPDSFTAQPSSTGWLHAGPMNPQHSQSVGSIVPISGNIQAQINGSSSARVPQSSTTSNGMQELYRTYSQNPYPPPMTPLAAQVSSSAQWPSTIATDSSSAELHHKSQSSSAWSHIRVPPAVDEKDHESDEEEDPGDPGDVEDQSGSPPDSAGLSPSGDIPSGYQEEVDRIFFDYLNDLCSDLNAKDDNGEPIHQTLMPKKMKRLDESHDFRPFKFRIAAFTHCFMVRLAKEGYPEDKIPSKKVRNYLWKQPYILRFNEEGKKAKSKGNHIWNIHARRAAGGRWNFRPYQRQFAGFPTGLAYHGIPWEWSARIWDPQSSWQNVPVTFSSPELPGWLSWKDNVLSGVPDSDAVSCDIPVVATFNYNNQEGQLTHTFHINFAVHALDHSPVRPSSFPRSSAPSLSRPTMNNSQRSLTEGSVPRVQNRVPSDLIHIMENAQAQTSMQINANVYSGSQGYENLLHQAHVLKSTVDALHEPQPHSKNMHRIALCDAANGVASSAARLANFRLDSQGAGRLPTMNEVSAVTNEMIAITIVTKGTESNEVEIMHSAQSLMPPQPRPQSVTVM